MAEDSPRRGGSIIGPFLLAVIFLAVLGGGVGFSLGTLSKHQRDAALTQPDQTTPTRRDNGSGGGNGTGGGNGAGSGGGQNKKERWPPHTAGLAKARQLNPLLYLSPAQYQ